MTFNEAFKKARKEKGPGATFTWQGKRYSTNYAEESKSPSKTKSKAKPKRSKETVSAKDPCATKPKARPRRSSSSSTTRRTSPSTTTTRGRSKAAGRYKGGKGRRSANHPANR